MQPLLSFMIKGKSDTMGTMDARYFNILEKTAQPA